MTDEVSTELQALAHRKGFRLSRANQLGRYWLVSLDGMPAMNPHDDTPFFTRATALQFLLETPDHLVHAPADHQPHKAA